VAYAMLKGKV